MTRRTLPFLARYLVPLAWVGLGCATSGGPRMDDGLAHVSLRIARWEAAQAREGDLIAVTRAHATTMARDAKSAPRLGDALDDFLEENRRSLASEVTHWTQAQAESRYRSDGAIDRWPTLGEVLSSSAEDCDGLELIAHAALLSLGFPEERLYRAVLYNEDIRGFHLVTLWFEDTRDPWVIDPTGAATSELARLSALPSWIPVRIFDAPNSREAPEVGLTPSVPAAPIP